MLKSAWHNLFVRRFGQNLLILVGGECVTRLMTFVAFAHLARVLEPGVFGLLEIALAVLMIATLVTDFGFPTVGTRELTRDPRSAPSLVNRVVSAELLRGLATYAVLAAAVALLPLNATLKMLLWALGVSLFALPFMLTWVFQARRKMKWVAIPQMIRGGVFVLVVVILVRSPDQVLLVAVAEIAAISLAATALLLRYRLSPVPIRLGLSAACDRSLYAQSLPVGASQLIWVLRMFLPTIVLGIVLGQVYAGYYGAAHRLMMVAQTLMGVYFLNLFPTISEAAHTSRTKLVQILQHSLTMITWPALALALTVSIGASHVIRLVFGDQYMRPESISVLGVLIWLIPVLAWRRHGHSTLIALDRQKSELTWSLVGLILLVILLPVLTMAYGPLGAAWAMLLAELVATVLTFWCLKRNAPELSFPRCLASFIWSGYDVEEPGAAPVRA